MNRRLVLAGGCSLLFLPVLAGCYERLETFRYRLTVEVDTPEGPRSGSSVIEVETIDRGKGFPGPEAGGLRQYASGEAVVVDLPGGQTLFAVLKGDGPKAFNFPEATPFRIFDPYKKYGDDPDYERRHKVVAHGKGRHVLARAHYPLLVRFRDIRDPKTVERVDPDDLTASFGPGVKLKHITVEITDDPVTTGMQKRLPWLPQYYDKMLDGSKVNNSTQLPNNLSSGTFSTEIKP